MDLIKMRNGDIKRGDIFLANLEPIKGSEQGGIRPVLIIQNDVFNLYSPTTIIAPFTSKIPSKKYFTSLLISKEELKMKKDSTILLNQIRTIDKKRIIKKIGELDKFLMNQVNKAIKISLELD
jgi:mRNA interferase MazF